MNNDDDEYEVCELRNDRFELNHRAEHETWSWKKVESLPAISIEFWDLLLRIKNFEFWT
jgi:hypothetical protein